MDNISWSVINKYFEDNPYNLVAHHLDSYNTFIENDLKRIFKDNNPLRFLEKKKDEKGDDLPFECFIFMGGKDGDRIYYSKPVIYNDEQGVDAEYMYPKTPFQSSYFYQFSLHFRNTQTQYIYHSGY